jgi:hypothetical protein
MPGSAHYVSLAGLVALLTAGFLLLARLLNPTSRIRGAKNYFRDVSR